MSNAPDAILADGLVSYWTFDNCIALDAERCTVSDESGESYSVEVYGAAVIPGRKDGAISFDGIDDFGLIAHNDVFNEPNKTYQFWFKKTNDTIRDSPNDVDIEGLIYKGFDTGLNRVVSVNLRQAEPPFDLVFTTGVGAASLGRVERLQIIEPNTWYHVVAFVGVTEMKLYLDGELAGSQRLSSPPITNTAPMSIGMIPENAMSTRFFAGLIDDFRIYNRQLSENEITSLYELTE